MKKKPKKILRLAALALLLIVAAIFVLHEAGLDFATVRDGAQSVTKNAQAWMQHLNPVLLILLMAVLPMIGFSVTIIYLVAGAAFGGTTGFAVVTGITAVHLLGSHWLGRTFLRKPVEYLLRRRKIHVPEIPHGEEKSLSVIAVLTPGPPYFLRNYLLALSGIPLRTYFWIAWPIYVLRSCIVIFLGDVGSELTWERSFTVGGIFLLKVGICAFILFRMRNRYRTAHTRRRATPVTAS